MQAPRSGARSEPQANEERVAVSGPRVADPREDRSRAGTRRGLKLGSPSHHHQSVPDLLTVGTIRRANRLRLLAGGEPVTSSGVTAYE